MKLPILSATRLPVIGVVMILSISLAACGSSGSSSTTAPTTSSAGAATTATAASTAEPTAMPASTPTTAATEATDAYPAASPMASPEASEGTPVAGDTTILVRTDPKLGAILTDSKGFTLYFFTKDTTGKSVCNGSCATNWPPLMADGTPTAPDGVTGTLSVVTRDDGTQMVAYNGKPLYTYIKDTDPEDTYGQGVGEVWFVATP